MRMSEPTSRAIASVATRFAFNATRVVTWRIGGPSSLPAISASLRFSAAKSSATAGRPGQLNVDSGPVIDRAGYVLDCCFHAFTAVPASMSTIVKMPVNPGLVDEIVPVW